MIKQIFRIPRLTATSPEIMIYVKFSSPIDILRKIC